MNYHLLTLHHMVQLYHIVLSGSELLWYLPQDCIVTSWKGSCKKKSHPKGADLSWWRCPECCHEVCCSLLETEPFSLQHYKTHFWSFKDTVNDADKPIVTPSVRTLRAVTKGRPAQKKNPELQPEKILNVLSCSKIHWERSILLKQSALMYLQSICKLF